MSDQRYTPPLAPLEVPLAEPGEPVAAAEPLPFGGWLLLVAVGLIITPFRGTYTMATTYWPLFRDGAWARLTTESSPAYHVFWGPLIILEVAGNLALLALAAVTLAQFFKKSRKTPNLAIALYASSVAFILVDHIAVQFFPPLANHPEASDKRELFRAVIAAVIWIPYFRVSERVKKTFIRP